MNVLSPHAARAEKILKKIVVEQLAPRNGESTSGLMTGAAGRIVFLHAFASRNKSKETESAAAIETLLRHINEKLAGGFRLSSLARGAAGILWAQSHLHSEGYDPALLHPGLPALAEKLKRELEIFFREKNTDYLHGAAGIVNALASVKMLTRPDEEMIAAGFESCSVKTAAGVSWYRVAEAGRSGTPFFDTGMAHGSGAIINALMRLETKKKDILLQAATEDLCHRLSQQNPGEEIRSHSCLSHYYAWCSSSLGAAVVLLKALDRLGFAGEKQDVIVIVRNLLDQASTITAGLTDNCLCHGASGVAATLSQLHRQTGDAEIRTHLDAWHERILRLAEMKYGDSVLRQPPGADHSLLTGSAGEGLVLLHLQQENPFLMKLLNLS